MRPIEKPLPPAQSSIYQGPTRGQSANFVLQGALADTIDHYCSFCELPINVGDHIEDKRAARRGTLARLADWDYLLLSCRYCQENRSGTTINESDYLWPDTDNTFMLDGLSPFVYSYQDVKYVLKHSDGISDETGTSQFVIVQANASSPQHEKTQRLLDLFQLNTSAYDSQTNTLTMIDYTLATYPDRRLFLRTRAWNKALSLISALTTAQQDRLSTARYDMTLYNITTIAQDYGFWSVWMTAFWQQFHDASLLDRLFLSTTDSSGFVIQGYQAFSQPTAPPAEPTNGRPQRLRPTISYLLFTGTATGRITYQRV